LWNNGIHRIFGAGVRDHSPFLEHITELFREYRDNSVIFYLAFSLFRLYNLFASNAEYRAEPAIGLYQVFVAFFFAAMLLPG